MNSIGQVKMLETEEEIVRAEILRYEAFNFELDDYDFSNTFYYIQIKNGCVVPFGLYIKGMLVAGCYVSNLNGTLYIDHLFVKPMFQNTGLRFGRMLLRYILANKQAVEEIFKRKFSTSTIEPIDEKSEALYLKEGYEYKGEKMVKKI